MVKGRVGPISWFAVVGFSIACLISVVLRFGPTLVGTEFWDSPLLGWPLFILWPGAGFIMSGDTGRGTCGLGCKFLGFALAIGSNALLYALFGAMAVFCYRRLARTAERDPGGL